MLDKISIPNYSFKQEKFNSISHFIGVPIGFIILVTSFILLSLKTIRFDFFVGLFIYSISIISLYFASGLYHSESADNTNSKKIKRVLDHCTIYVLIAGTYTPICLYLASITYVGYILLAVEWFLAIIGIAINAIDFSNIYVKIISMVLYLGLGWLILFSGQFIYLPFESFLFILIGGIIYTIGSILYGIGHKKIYFHSIFHIFVLIGTILQAIGVLLLFI